MMEYNEVEHEWPGSAEVGQQGTTRVSRERCMRLLVKSSLVLSKRRKLAVLDAYDEVQIGRDVSHSTTVPRIRLKDMEVSKLHATIFWDHARDAWSVVDMGSKHGTYVSQESHLSKPNAQSMTSVEANSRNGQRLSESRKASLPKSLHHGDLLSVGSTDFVVHIHSDGVPCEECSSEDGFDIPLFHFNEHTDKVSESDKNLSQATPQETRVSSSQNPRKALAALRKSLLSRHTSQTSIPSASLDQSQSSYVDRSAKRRAMFPDLPLEPVGPSPTESSILSTGSRPGVYRDLVARRVQSPAHSPSIPSTPPTPPQPLPASNIGHRLLESQGWAPGRSLGLDLADSDQPSSDDDRKALRNPLEVAANPGKLGLGMKRPTSESSEASGQWTDWKEKSRKRRWEEVQLSSS